MGNKKDAKERSEPHRSERDRLASTAGLKMRKLATRTVHKAQRKRQQNQFPLRHSQVSNSDFDMEAFRMYPDTS